MLATFHSINHVFKYSIIQVFNIPLSLILNLNLILIPHSIIRVFKYSVIQVFISPLTLASTLTFLPQHHLCHAYLRFTICDLRFGCGANPRIHSHLLSLSLNLNLSLQLAVRFRV
jgi:hypothetical protein